MNEQRLIIAFYVAVGNMSPQKSQSYLSDLFQSLTIDKDENEKYIIIPIKEGESRVEVLNPTRLSDEDYKSIEARADKMENKLNTFFSAQHLLVDTDIPSDSDA